MSWNHKKVVTALFLSLMATCVIVASEHTARHIKANQQKVKQKSVQEKIVIIDGLTEDEWIVRAIWLEDYGVFSKSREVYSKLYAATGKKEYLFKEVSSSIFGNTHIGESLKKLKAWSASHPDDLASRRLLLALYMNLRAFDEATKVGNYLLKHSSRNSDLELAANPYLFSGEYKKGVELLKKLYRKTKNENVLLRIAVIEAQYLNEPKKAIQMLETHRRIEDASPDVYKILIDLYLKEKKIDHVLELYKSLYKKEPKTDYLSKIIEIYVYNRNFDGLIRFLESNHANDEILYDLYKREKHYKKAIKLSDTFYLSDNNPKWIAEKAILTYEAADDKDDREMLNEVAALFDKAISLGVDDSIYLNYYGYTLIDKDMDIDKGLDLIRQALHQQPENSYYMDSLAWGYYKKGECLKAYTTMEKVVAEEGTKESEIKEHWEKIQQCQKPVVVGFR